MLQSFWFSETNNLTLTPAPQWLTPRVQTRKLAQLCGQILSSIRLKLLLSLFNTEPHQHLYLKAVAGFRDCLPLEKQLSHQTTDWPPSSQFQSLNSKAGIYYTSGDGSSCLKNINEDVGLGTLCKTVVSKQFITAFTNASLDLTMWSTYISNIQKHRGLLCRAEI